MAKDMDKEHGEGCTCGCQNGMCGCHGGMCGGLWGHYHWGHMIIKLFIVLFIFWAGMQFGELKAAVDNFEGGGMGYGHSSYYLNGAQGDMMGGRTTSAMPAQGVTVQMMRVATGSPRQ